MKAYPGSEGLQELEPILASVNEREAAQHATAEQTDIPCYFEQKVVRSLTAPVSELVARQVIRSGETLAVVLPQITAQIKAAGIDDPTLRRLYDATYRAFRKRRSLLLRNQQSQVRLTELPWVACMEPFRKPLSAAKVARSTLLETALLTIQSFPHVILPNPLMTEFQALAGSAGLKIHFTRIVTRIPQDAI